MLFYDPQSSDISPAFTAAFMSYYTTELKVSKDKNYNTGAYSFLTLNGIGSIRVATDFSAMCSAKFQFGSVKCHVK
jgi:hypothetical protein